MDERIYIMTARKTDASTIMRHMYIRAATLAEARKKAENSPMMRGWKVTSLQPTAQRRTYGWYTM